METLLKTVLVNVLERWRWTLELIKSNVSGYHLLILARAGGIRCNHTSLRDHLFLASKFRFDAAENVDEAFKFRALERDIADRVTVSARSANDVCNGRLGADARAKAARSLLDDGICVIPRLFPPENVLRIGAIAMEDMAEALALLKKSEGIDLLDPTVALKRPVDNYHEVSTREALRCDLRDGPNMSHERNLGDMMNSGVRDVVEDVFNPRGPHSSGNWGKWNFNGDGPNSRIRCRIGRIGCVLSFPGSKSQALHADTPHLLDSYDALPAHYLNCFCPACPDPDLAIGQTAFIVGSHKMSCSARLVRHDTDKAALRELRQRLFRPHLEPGDALIFDARILHFGLPNRHPSLWRPIVYVNYTQPWFDRLRTDKNWGKKSIFKDLADSTSEASRAEVTKD
eukprot:g229.t1